MRGSPHLPCELLLQNLLQDDRLVVLRIPRSVDERHVTPPPGIKQGRQCVLMRSELSTVTPLELVPSRRVVAEPLAELGAGRDVLQPTINLELVLRHAAWPHAGDPEPRAI